jgi:hypothetical protein
MIWVFIEGDYSFRGGGLSPTGDDRRRYQPGDNGEAEALPRTHSGGPGRSTLESGQLLLLKNQEDQEVLVLRGYCNRQDLRVLIEDQDATVRTS